MAPRIGLVLGAGGVVGQAYHAGVLAALEHDLGWDPRTADVIVGSSAGSVTGSLLRLGVSASDLAAWAVEAPLSVEGAPMMEQLGPRGADPDFPKPSPIDLLRPWRLPSVALLRRVAARPWAFRPSTSAMTMVPDGRIDIVEKAEVLHAISGQDWPDGLWICAARRRDGGRVVFGRPGSPYALLGRAVAASCAIPGYFAPVRIGNVSYFDGGVHSPTNADVLRDERLDLVVVVSPMSADRGVARTADAPMRFLAHRKLQSEVGRLRARGTPVVTFEPGPRALPVMGLNAMATDRADRVVQAAFLEAGRRAATGTTAERLRPLVSRPGRLRATP
ncbi:MAG TPA: patatin-like phospholipase family protein [Acidimicrobiales bacterium]|nr:patatin-like phospholipase family protein [Acidimicrobiales bacterium]